MPTQAIKVVDLLIDTLNPRIEDEPPNQREAIQAVAELQREKLAVLAEDIVEYGINPSDSPIVMPAPKHPNQHIVLEGNRRLSALKALENPDLLVGAVAYSDEIVHVFRSCRPLSERSDASINIILSSGRHGQGRIDFSARLPLQIEPVGVVN